MIARPISRSPLPPQLSICLLPLLSDFSVPSLTRLARPSHCAGKTTAFRCLYRAHLSTPHQPGAGGLLFSLSALSVMAPQQFCKRALLKVCSQCFLGTEKVVMVLWFIFLIWKQSSILRKAVTSDLEKKTCVIFYSRCFNCACCLLAVGWLKGKGYYLVGSQMVCPFPFLVVLGVEPSALLRPTIALHSGLKWVLGD